MDSIEADDLYEERGAVSFSRPILQGDIFEGVVLPGFGDEPKRVQIVTHPCSMRRGPVSNERIQVAPVDSYQKVGDWNGHGRVMPLPDLLSDGKWHATKFVDLTAVAAPELTLDRRIASLSHPGIHVLQQRLVWHNTRLTLDLAKFRQQSAPILAEAEMQELWIDAVLDEGARTADAVEAAGVQFQAWLSEDDNRRRAELDAEANHAKLRRETRAAALERRG
ncbi:hypothetical protein [Tessaracoccus palaemonis]|uniref:Uncharacterized protein n=1 Tax=Tessaracoccus palaemonis TaxID=2829499 RepID=A0ABX8SIF8_9ACTN|nr:hypothetical protein [Tessaracoccus palaemonis]QXT63171.1 hypothetical protein KDB89_01410 [Tessaracoccus palaemonis]